MKAIENKNEPSQLVRNDKNLEECIARTLKMRSFLACNTKFKLASTLLTNSVPKFITLLALVTHS